MRDIEVLREYCRLCVDAECCPPVDFKIENKFIAELAETVKDWLRCRPYKKSDVYKAWFAARAAILYWYIYLPDDQSDLTTDYIYQFLFQHPDEFSRCFADDYNPYTTNNAEIRIEDDVNVVYSLACRWTKQITASRSGLPHEIDIPFSIYNNIKYRDIHYDWISDDSLFQKDTFEVFPFTWCDLHKRIRDAYYHVIQSSVKGV